MTKEILLEDILEGYAVETPTGNDLNILQKWMEKYPQFSTELMDFAAARAQGQYTSEPELLPEEEQRYAEIGLGNLKNFLSQREVPVESMSSLTGLASERGLNKAKLAAALNISLSLVMYLEKKRLKFASIPKIIINRLASVLEVSEAAISDYLNQSPDLATNVSYKAQTRPEEIEQKDFAEVVRQDQTLSSQQKNELLQLE